MSASGTDVVAPAYLNAWNDEAEVEVVVDAVPALAALPVAGVAKMVRADWALTSQAHPYLTPWAAAAVPERFAHTWHATLSVISALGWFGRHRPEVMALAALTVMEQQFGAVSVDVLGGAEDMAEELRRHAELDAYRGDRSCAEAAVRAGALTACAALGQVGAVMGKSVSITRAAVAATLALGTAAGSAPMGWAEASAYAAAGLSVEEAWASQADGGVSGEALGALAGLIR